MMLLVLLEIFIKIHNFYLEAVLQKWKSLIDYNKKQKVLKVFNNFPTRPVTNFISPHIKYNLVAYAFEVIPRTLIANCGVNVIRTITALRQKHATKDGLYFGIDGNKGVIANMKEVGIWEPLAVKA